MPRIATIIGLKFTVSSLWRTAYRSRCVICKDNPCDHPYSEQNKEWKFYYQSQLFNDEQLYVSMDCPEFLSKLKESGLELFTTRSKKECYLCPLRPYCLTTNAAKVQVLVDQWDEIYSFLREKLEGLPIWKRGTFGLWSMYITEDNRVLYPFSKNQ